MCEIAFYLVKDSKILAISLNSNKLIFKLLCFSLLKCCSRSIKLVSKVTNGSYITHGLSLRHTRQLLRQNTFIWSNLNSVSAWKTTISHIIRMLKGIGGGWIYRQKIGSAVITLPSFILTAKPKITKLVKDLEHLAHSKYSEMFYWTNRVTKGVIGILFPFLCSF